jgi:hypothetical protein
VQDLMATDRETMSGRNVKMQEAIATTKLRAEKELINKLEICIHDLVMVVGVVKAKRADLKDIQSRLKDQLNLCRDEIALGAHWGSKPPPGIDGPDLASSPVTNRRTLEKIQDLVDEGTVDLGVEDVAAWTEGDDSDAEVVEPGEAPDEFGVDDLLAEVAEVEQETKAEQGAGDTDVEVMEEDPDKAIREVEDLLAEASAEMGDMGFEESEDPDEAALDEEQEEVEDLQAEEVSDMPDLPDTVADDLDLDSLIDEVSDSAVSGSEPEVTGSDPEEEPEEPSEEDEPSEEEVVSDVEIPEDIGELFEGEESAPAEEGVLEASTTDEEVDDIFSQMDVKSKKKASKPTVVADDDLDDLVAMFSQ